MDKTPIGRSKNNVRDLRLRFGLTQKALAGKAEISIHSLRGIETGRRQSSSPALVPIFLALADASTGSPVSFRDVFPNHLPPANRRSASEGVALTAAADGASGFFALDAGPFGNPPVMTIRGFSDTPAGTCGMPSFNTAAFDFTATGQACSGSPICKAN